MTVSAAKKKLHDYIDHADEQKVFDLLALFESSSSKNDFKYDEETLDMLRKRSDEYFAHKQKSYTIEESIELVRQHRKQNGI